MFTGAGLMLKQGGGVKHHAHVQLHFLLIVFNDNNNNINFINNYYVLTTIILFLR